MSAYREPGRDVDVTEIERAKIHEAAETQRVLIAEREKTRRVKVEEYGSSPYVAAVIIAIAVLFTSGYVAHLHFASKRPPEPLEGCVEKTEIIGTLSAMRTCDNGGHVETSPTVGGEVLWKCICGPRTDRGAP